MGSFCSNPQDGTQPDTYPAVRYDAIKEYPPEIRTKSLRINCTSEECVGFCIQTPPILNDNKSQIIFISSSSCIMKTKYAIYDLNKDKFIREEDIKCGDDKNDVFDIANTVYTLNPNTNQIYLIENNKDIKVLDLNQNKLISLNKTIETTEDNYAQIECINNRIYILGAEKIVNDNEDSQHDKVLSIIPYSLCNNNYTSDLSVLDEFGTTFFIKGFGRSSRTMIIGANSKTQLICRGFIRLSTMELPETLIPEEIYRLCYEFYPKESQYVLIMGGLTKVPQDPWISNADMIDPDKFVSSDTIFVCDINNSKWRHNFKQRQTNGCTYYLAGENTYRHSFGVINYRDKYLFQLGGIKWTYNESSSNREFEEQKTDEINVLILQKNNEYNLDQFAWYQLPIKLPRELGGHIHCIYDDIHNDDLVHIFTYRGYHYTFKIVELLTSMEDEMELTYQYLWTKNGGYRVSIDTLQKLKTLPVIDHYQCKVGPFLKASNLDSVYKTMADWTYGKLGDDYDSVYGDVLREVYEDVGNDLDRLMNKVRDMGIEVNEQSW